MAKKKVSSKKQRSANSYRTNSKPSSVTPSTASSPSPQLQDPVVSVRRRKGTPVRSPSQNDTSKGIVFSFRIQPDSEMTMAVDIRSYDQQLRDDDDADADNDLLENMSGSTQAKATAQEEQHQQQSVLSGGALRTSTVGATRGAGANLPGTANLLKELQQQPHSANHTLPAPTTLATTTSTASGHNNNDNLPMSSSPLSTSPQSSSAPSTSNSASAAMMTAAEWENVGPGPSGSLTRVAGGEWSNNLWTYRENNVMDLSRNLLVLHARRPPCRSWTTGSTPPSLSSSCSSSPSSSVSQSSASFKSRTQQRAPTSLFHPYSKNNSQSSLSSSSLSASSQSSSSLCSATSPTSSSIPSTPALSSAASSASASPASSPSSPTLCQSPERDYLAGGKDDPNPLLEGVTGSLLADAPAPLDAVPTELLAKSKSRFLTVRGLGGGRGRTRMEVIVVS
ncbi:hypothetical protein BGW41_000185 [Actinomortierella wolfii]|nr:hypothetical protein BGW41_000185 [Actinomortierella wolfii]